MNIPFQRLKIEKYNDLPLCLIDVLDKHLDDLNNAFRSEYKKHEASGSYRFDGEALNFKRKAKQLLLDRYNDGLLPNNWSIDILLRTQYASIAKA